MALPAEPARKRGDSLRLLVQGWGAFSAKGHVGVYTTSQPSPVPPSTLTRCLWSNISTHPNAVAGPGCMGPTGRMLPTPGLFQSEGETAFLSPELLASFSLSLPASLCAARWRAACEPHPPLRRACGDTRACGPAPCPAVDRASPLDKGADQRHLCPPPCRGGTCLAVGLGPMPSAPLNTLFFTPATLMVTCWSPCQCLTVSRGGRRLLLRAPSRSVCCLWKAEPGRVWVSRRQTFAWFRWRRHCRAPLCQARRSARSPVPAALWGLS